MASSFEDTSVQNGTSETLTLGEWQERVHTTALLASLGSCSIVLNALPILLTFCTEMRKNNVHIMVANLSTAELLFSITFVFGHTQYMLYREQIDDTACQWLAGFTFVSAMFGFIFAPFVSMNRYIALYHKQHYDRVYTRRNIALMILGVWVFSTIPPMVFTLNGKTKFDDDNQHCCIVVKDSPIGWTVFYWLSITIPVGFSDGAMAFFNYKMYKKLFQHEATNRLENNVVKQNKELLYFFLVDMTVPILVQTPYHIIKFLFTNRVDIHYKRLFISVYVVSLCGRGLACLTLLRPYRVAMKKLLRTLTFSRVATVVPVIENYGR